MWMSTDNSCISVIGDAGNCVATVFAVTYLAGIATAAPVEVPQLASQASFDEHCVSKGAGVCVVGLLDGTNKQ
jgi:hypothetical protein